MLIAWVCLIIQTGYVMLAKMFGMEIESVYLFGLFMVGVIGTYFQLKTTQKNQGDDIKVLKEYHNRCQREQRASEDKKEKVIQNIEKKIDEVNNKLDHKYDELYTGQQEILQTIIQIIHAKSI